MDKQSVTIPPITKVAKLAGSDVEAPDLAGPTEASALLRDGGFSKTASTLEKLVKPVDASVSMIANTLADAEHRAVGMFGWKTARHMGLNNDAVIERLESRRKHVARECFHGVAWSALLLIVSVSLYLTIGVLYYHLTLGWSVLESAFFCTVTISTVGYGGKGLEPTSEGSRMFTVFYIFFGILVVFIRMTDLFQQVTSTTHHKMELVFEEQRERRLLHRQNKAKGAGTADEPKPESGSAPGFWRFYGVNIGVYLGLVVAFVLLSAAIFCWTEQSADRPADADALSYVDAIYFTWITITTLGYSDSFITTKASMVWCIFFIFTGAGFFAAVASHVASLRQVCDLP